MAGNMNSLGPVPASLCESLPVSVQNGSTFIRPISARYMHKKELEHYDKENPGL